MLAAGVQPTATTYTTLIGVYGKVGQLQQSLEVFQVGARAGWQAGCWVGQAVALAVHSTICRIVPGPPGGVLPGHRGEQHVAC